MTNTARGRLDGRVCLVTGAGNGIGRATALAMAAEGGHVLALDVDAEAAKATAELDHAIRPFVADVSRRDQLAEAVAGLVAEHGRVDVLVNNAAVNLPGLFHEASQADIARTVEVNILGAVHASQLVVPHMLARGSGAIVTISSVNAMVAEPFLSIYAMSKAALVMLTRGMALDYAGAGLRANVICPGWVDTPFNHAHARLLGGLDAVYDSIESFQPIGRPGRPEEIASVAVFLASDEASLMTGSVVVADGGMTVQ
ncbi:MAG: SDR family oxidoreductase [Nocardioides sp.]|uniref:SDR family NAD(P)-dependent oxidoreductase n=1 Tax=Nocardioides sp. TaxID=35761 RepID=UPI0039E216C4